MLNKVGRVAIQRAIRVGGTEEAQEALRKRDEGDGRGPILLLQYIQADIPTREVNIWMEESCQELALGRVQRVCRGYLRKNLVRLPGIWRVLILHRQGDLPLQKRVRVHGRDGDAFVGERLRLPLDRTVFIL